MDFFLGVQLHFTIDHRIFSYSGRLDGAIRGAFLLNVLLYFIPPTEDDSEFTIFVYLDAFNHLSDD